MEKKENINTLLSKIKKVDEKNISVENEKKYWGEAKNHIVVNMHTVSYPKELFYDKVPEGYIKVGSDSPITGMSIGYDNLNGEIKCSYGYKLGKGETIYEGHTHQPNGEITSKQVMYYFPETDIPVDKSSPDDENVNNIQGGDLSAGSFLREFITNYHKTKKDTKLNDARMEYVDNRSVAKGLGRTQRALTRFLKKANIQVSSPLVPIHVKGYQVPVFVPLDKYGRPSIEGTGYMVIDNGKDKVKIQIFDWDRLKKEANNEYSKLHLSSKRQKEKDQCCFLI